MRTYCVGNLLQKEANNNSLSTTLQGNNAHRHDATSSSLSHSLSPPHSTSFENPSIDNNIYGNITKESLNIITDALYEGRDRYNQQLYRCSIKFHKLSAYRMANNNGTYIL